MNKAIFLDKDGTLVVDVPYSADPKKIKFTPHAFEGLKILHDLGYKLVIVSNQRGLALGKFNRSDLQKGIKYLESKFKKGGVELEAFYFCPHDPTAKLDQYARVCSCRKPKPGMLIKAAQDLRIDLDESWMIGDILDDMEAGKKAGCRTILVGQDNKTDWFLPKFREPDYQVNNLLEAASVIISKADKYG